MSDVVATLGGVQDPTSTLPGTASVAPPDSVPQQASTAADMGASCTQPVAPLVELLKPPGVCALNLPAAGGDSSANAGMRLNLSTSTLVVGGGETVRKSEKLLEFANVCSEILPYLFVGGGQVAGNLSVLQEAGVTHVVNCSGGVVPNHFAEHLEYTEVVMYDAKQEPIQCFFLEVLSVVETVRRGGGRVLIHCTQGVSRSCSFCIAYLMWQQSWTYHAAFAHVRARRGIASPNIGFVCQLTEWGKGVVEWQTPRPFPRAMLYEMVPHPSALRVLCRGEGDGDRAALSLPMLEASVVPFAVHNGPGRFGGATTERALELSATNLDPLHSQGCFLLHGQGPQEGTKGSLLIWVGSECVGVKRDLMVRAAQRAAGLLSWSIGGQGEGDEEDKAGVTLVPIVEQGSSAVPDRWQQVLAAPAVPVSPAVSTPTEGGVAPTGGAPRGPSHAIYTLLSGVAPEDIDSYFQQRLVLSADNMVTLETSGASSGGGGGGVASGGHAKESAVRTASNAAAEPLLQPGGASLGGPAASGSAPPPSVQASTPAGSETQPSSAHAPPCDPPGDGGSDSGQSSDNGASSELFQYVDGAWERLGSHEEDDLVSTGFFVLVHSCPGPASTADKGAVVVLYTWTGTECPPSEALSDTDEVERQVKAGTLETTLVTVVEGGEGAAVACVEAAREGEESEAFWDAFEAGY